MIAGRLEVEMAANLARLRKDMQDATGMLSGWARDVDRTLSSVKGMFAAFGAGLSVGAFAAFIKNGVDALDTLGDLSKATRIAVEDLSGLEFAAKQSGSTLDATANAINKLAINMGKNAEKFSALGVTARDPIEAMKQLADVTNAIQDPQQRAAVLADALGKSWKEVAPLLAEGSKRMGEMIDRGKEMSGVTQALVDEADAFNDKMVELSGNGGRVNAVLAEMLPLLNKTADGLLEGGKSTDIWSAAGKAFAEILRVVVVLAGNVGFVLRGIGTEIGGLAAQAAAVATGDFARAAEIGRQMKEDARANRLAFDEWEKSIMAVGSASRSTTKALDTQDQVSRRMAADASASARAFLEAEKRRKDAEAEQKRMFAEAERLRKDDIAGWVKYADAVFDEADRLNLDLAKISDRFWKQERQNREMSDAEWVKFIDQQIDEYERGLTEMAAMQPSFTQRWTAMWEQVSDVAGGFFSDLVMNGKSAFDNLRRWVKQLLADMIGLFAKRWILNMAAGGSVLGSAGNALAGGTGSDSLTGMALNGVGSLASSYLGIGGAGVGASMWGAMGAGTVATETGVVLATGSMAGTSIGTGAMAGVYSALAAIPVWGWIAMAVIAIGAWIAGNHKGGDKVGGSFFSGGAVPGTDNGRFFTPNQGDDGMRQLVEATSRGYTDAVTRLGGNAGGFNFGLGFDHDPRGTARSRVSSMLTDANGRVIYSAMDREMDDKEVEGALGLESQRMVIAALRESDLHDELDAYFDKIGDVAALTGEQIQALLAGAMELKGVIDVLALWDNGLTVQSIRDMAREGETLAQTLNSVAQAQATYYQLFYTEEEQLALKTELLRKQFEAMGIEMPSTREAFRQLVESLDLTTEAGSQFYRWLLEVAPAFADIVQPAAEMVDAVEEVSDAMVAATVLIDASLNQNVRPWEDIFNGYYAGRGARNNIGDYLSGLMSGSSSPLDPMQRFGASQQEYQRVLGLSQGGDIEAMMKLPGVHKTMIDLARSIWGSSSAFVSIFERSFNEVAAVGEVPDYQSRMLSLQTDSLQYQAQTADTLIDVRDILTRIAEKSGTATADSWGER